MIVRQKTGEGKGSVSAFRRSVGFKPPGLQRHHVDDAAMRVHPSGDPLIVLAKADGENRTPEPPGNARDAFLKRQVC